VVIETIGAAIAFAAVAITAAAAVGSSFRSSRTATAINNYRQLAESWEARANDFEMKNTILAEQLAALTARVEVLQELVTSKARVDTLAEVVGDQMRGQTERAAKWDARVTEVLHQINEVRIDVRSVQTALGVEPSERGTT
jgi:hypothetical protein